MRVWRAGLLLVSTLGAAALAGCGPVPPEPATRAVVVQTTLPPLQRFTASRPTAPFKNNREIARDFIDLSFRMESGRPLPVLTRFEGPISVRVAGSPPPLLREDLTALLLRLRREAGIDIALRRADQPASITIEAVRRADIRRILPQAACFVVPNVGSFAEFRGVRRAAQLSWANLTERRRVAIFVPRDASPQDVRDCLHEEVAQALGPLNDLYRLTDSVFNDDNVHTVLTGFDMVILRATYDPTLRSGMTEGEVAQRLPGILARINPAGQRQPDRQIEETPAAWAAAIQTALGPDAGLRTRQRAAVEAVRIAEARGWRDHRRGFSHYVHGRYLQPTDPAQAALAFGRAERLLAAAPATEMHRALVDLQRAALALAARDAPAVLRLATPAQSVAMRHENAAVLAMLLLLRAEALTLAGRQSEAHAVRMDSLGWARYGFGTDWALRAKAQDIARVAAGRTR